MRVCATNIFVILLVVLEYKGANALPRSHLFPYGVAEGDDTIFRNDDANSAELISDVPYIFYGEPRTSIYVNTNGIITFTGFLDDFTNSRFPRDVNYQTVATFFGDVDTRGHGWLFFRTTSTDPAVERINATIQNICPEREVGFNAESITVATWENVGYYFSRTDFLNTFQCVMATNGTDTFVFFLYNTINWIRARATDRTQVGFDAGDNIRFFIVPGTSIDEGLLSLVNTTNMDVPGMYGFKVSDRSTIRNAACIRATVVPQTNVAFEGHTEQTVFVCEATFIDDSAVFLWIVNGLPLNFNPIPGASLASAGRVLRFQRTILEQNGTTVQCRVTTSRDIDTDMGTLLVQEALSAVTNLVVEYARPSFHISWSHPVNAITLASTSYCVSIRTSNNNTLVNECEIVGTSFSAQVIFDPCSTYYVTVTPVNPVGNGEATIFTFIPLPRRGVVASDFSIAAESANTIRYEASLPFPVCLCEVTLSGTAGMTTRQCAANLNETIAFTVTEPFLNQYFTASVALISKETNFEVIRSNVNLSSHEVQSNITATNAYFNDVTIVVSYIKNSFAMGALIVMISTDESQVNFGKSLYLVSSELESSYCRVSEGNYTVLVFDVNSDGEPASGTITPAAVGSVAVSGHIYLDFYPRVPSFHGCAVASEQSIIKVRCLFSTSELEGYLVVLHSMESDLSLRTARTTSTQSVVVLQDVSDGLHNVLVFPLTSNGVIGTNVAFSKEISV